jgi:hypothetical protein
MAGLGAGGVISPVLTAAHSAQKHIILAKAHHLLALDFRGHGDRDILALLRFSALATLHGFRSQKP